MEDIKVIREKFRKYLYKLVADNKLSKVDADTQYSDADYPRKHADELGINYWEAFRDDASLENLLSILKERFEKEGKNPSTIVSYKRALKSFRNFIEEQYAGVKNMRNGSQKKYYWVCQGQQKEDKKYILAPVDNFHHHKRVNELKVGDVVISYFNQQVNAISTVIKNPEIIKNGNDDWYKAVLDYKELDKPIPKSVIKNIMKKNNIKSFIYGPFNVNYDYNQGYLFNFSKELLDLILENDQEVKIMKSSRKEEKQPLNQILYGPPGTGKTFSVRKYIDEILGKNPGLNIENEDQRINNAVKDSNWYSAIALSMYQNGKNNKYKVAELLEQKIIKTFSLTRENKNVRAALWAQMQIHTHENCPNVNYSNRLAPFIFEKNENSEWYLTEDGIKFVEENLSEQLEQLNAKNNTRKLEDFYKFLTFHQSYSYEEFVEGIKPQIRTDEECSSVSYEYNKGVFKEICQQANSDPDNNYLLIIDEINRGNISKIFGELITLIEINKRVMPNGERIFENTVTKDEQLLVTLPYTKSKFGVPNNLYILGTMNTSDRSIASIDIALRRRFKFVEMMPNSDLVADFECNFKEIFEKLNTKIKILLDRDHQIGHSYFINTKYNNNNENNNVETLKDIWFSEILPLLNEYFYCDWEKLKLIIPGFIKKLDVPEILKNECDDSIYEFKTFDEVEYFEKALNQEKFEQV